MKQIQQCSGRGSLRRRVFGVFAASLVVAAGVTLVVESAQAQQGKLKVGLMLPYTGTYAALGNSITNAFKLAIEESGGKAGGREIEYFTVDDESDPAKAPDNANKLIKRDQVDVLVGTVHSGVALAMAKVARDNNTLLIIPNAGADDITGPLCAPNIFRTSFSNSQMGVAMGKVMAEQKKKTAVTFTWKYAAGDESVGGFKEAFEAGGGKVVKELSLPFPQVEFQSYLTEIAALKPDVVYVFLPAGARSSSSRITRPPVSTRPFRWSAQASSPTGRSRRKATQRRGCSRRCITATGSTIRRTTRFVPRT